MFCLERVKKNGEKKENLKEFVALHDVRNCAQVLKEKKNNPTNTAYWVNWFLRSFLNLSVHKSRYEA